MGEARPSADGLGPRLAPNSPYSLDGGGGVHGNRVAVTTLLPLVKDAMRPIDGVNLRVEDLLIGAEAGALAGPPARGPPHARRPHPSIAQPGAVGPWGISELMECVVVFLLFTTPLPLRTAANILTPPSLTEIPSPTTMGHTGAALSPASHTRRTKGKKRATPLPTASPKE